MGDKAFYSLTILIILILLFLAYWFIPLNTTKFTPLSNFSINNSENSSVQFYSNMRFPETSISYKITNCSLKRINDMTWAFNIVSGLTTLIFYPVEYGQQITITCEDTLETEGNLFIAGEGGPTNVTADGYFNIIEAGKILLLRDANCERPNIQIHELLHVLGFVHSNNPGSIMYKISRCDQTLSSDITNYINSIYSIPSEPDLLFDDASAVMRGKYLDVNFSVRNYGLKYSGKSIVKIIVNEKEVKEINLPPIELGEGIYEYRNNILMNQINIQNIKFVIEYNFNEINKTNNIFQFEIKK